MLLIIPPFHQHVSGVPFPSQRPLMSPLFFVLSQVINLERDLVKLRAALENGGGGSERAAIEEVGWRWRT